MVEKLLNIEQKIHQVLFKPKLNRGKIWHTFDIVGNLSMSRIS
jgi:hypothetical protein